MFCKSIGPETKIKPDIVIIRAEGMGANTSSIILAKKTPKAPQGNMFVSKNFTSISITYLSLSKKKQMEKGGHHK